MSPSHDDINVYINFALYAVLGKLGEADGLMTAEGERIYRVASYLAAQRPIQPKPLFRGMLVAPGTSVQADKQYKFISWSEDRDVACWFASRDSYISAPLVEAKPHLQGVVLELAAPQRILFHYSWAGNWWRLAMLHPDMGPEGARQIAWSLRTQREVITGPLPLPSPMQLDDIPHSIEELDRRFTPPWVIA